jgi:hypothetical protein
VNYQPALLAAVGMWLGCNATYAQSDKNAELEKDLAARRAELKKVIEEMYDRTKGVSDVCPVLATHCVTQGSLLLAEGQSSSR